MTRTIAAADGPGPAPSGPAARAKGGGWHAFVVRAAPQLLLLLLVLVLLVVDPGTIAGGNIGNVLVNAAPVAVLGLGAMWVLIGGGLDLSAGFGVAMCALVLAALLDDGVPLGVAVLAGLAAGLLLGLVNGVLVGVVGMPAFIATLATMVAVQGITLVLGSVGTIIITDPVLDVIGTGSIGPVPAPALYAVGVALVVGFAARLTRFGTYTYGVGSDAAAMTGRGISVARQQVLIFLFGGLLTAATAVLLVARVQIVDPKIAGTSMLLDAFAATILGGTSLFGGRGSVIGTLTGALVISLITTNLVTLGVSAQNVDLLKGAMIVIAVVVDAAVRFLERRGPTAVPS